VACGDSGAAARSGEPARAIDSADAVATVVTAGAEAGLALVPHATAHPKAANARPLDRARIHVGYAISAVK
jgi:hypothetical protein